MNMPPPNRIKKFTRTIAAVAAMATIGSALLATPAFAVKGDYARFNICKQMKSAGTMKWHGIATGTEDDALSTRDRTFHTRACFTTQKACKTWVKRIWWEIPTMDELHNAWCRKL